MENSLYGAFLRLQGRRCKVIGGGVVAERKIHALLGAGALVQVVSPKVTPAVARWAAQGQLEWEERRYRPGELEGCVLVVAATQSESINAGIADEADARGIFVNVVNLPERCTFLVPATLQHGPLQLAITTSGQSPTVAKQLRDDLHTFLQGYEEYVQLMAEYRQRLHQEIIDEPIRIEAYREFARSPIREWLKQEEREHIEGIFTKIVERRKNK